MAGLPSRFVEKLPHRWQKRKRNRFQSLAFRRACSVSSLVFTETGIGIVMKSFPDAILGGGCKYHYSEPIKSLPTIREGSHARNSARQGRANHRRRIGDRSRYGATARRRRRQDHDRGLRAGG